MVRRSPTSKRGKDNSPDGLDAGGSSSSRRTRRSSGEHANSPAHSTGASAMEAEAPPLVETEEERAKREEIFNIMREKTDLPSVYGILEVAREYFPKEKRASLPKEDRTLFDQAEVAASYLMFKELVDHISRPLSFGGLALSDAKSNEVAKKVFTAIGPVSGLGNISENKITKKTGLPKRVAAKVILQLHQVGEEARSQVEPMRNEILPEQHPIAAPTETTEAVQ